MVELDPPEVARSALPPLEPDELVLADAVVDDEEDVGMAGSAVDCVAIALIDELRSAVGGVGVGVDALLIAELPPNGRKKSRANAPWLRFGLNRNGPSAFALQFLQMLRLNPSPS